MVKKQEKVTKTKPQKKVSKRGEIGRKNLIPINQRTKEEAQLLGKQGGQASGRARNKKKKLREQLRVVVEILTENKLKEGGLTPDQEVILENSDVLISGLYDLIHSNKEEIKLKAIESLIDRTHGKVATVIEGDVEKPINIKINWGDKK
jgi:hypothetical protein